MSDLLSIGASSVAAYQTALSTVSENIANANTAGYTRRSAVMNEVSSAVGGVTSRIVTSGNGVVVSHVARASDPLKVTAARIAGADLAKTEGSQVWLSRIQSSLTDAGLGDAVTAFFNAATTLAADPTSATSRAGMVEAATTTAGAFSATGRALSQASSDLDANAALAATQLSSMAAGLATINEGLSRSQPGSTVAAALADQRDQLLDQMSALVDTHVDTDALGRVSVRLGSSTGPLLIEGTYAGAVDYARNKDGTASFTLIRGNVGSPVSPQGGALAGYVDGAQRLHDAIATLGDVASAFATGVNAVQAQGRDQDNNPGQPIFAQGSDPTQLTMVLTDGRGIAAASVGGGSRDASNLDSLQALRAAQGYETKITDQVATNAAVIEGRQTVADAQTAIRNGAVADRDAVSEVNLDTEAVDLLRFQQAYSAASRVVQVARECFQSLIAIN